MCELEDFCGIELSQNETLRYWSLNARNKCSQRLPLVEENQGNFKNFFKDVVGCLFCRQLLEITKEERHE